MITVFFPRQQPAAVNRSGAVSVREIEMTPLMEVPLDPAWPARVQQAIESQSDDFFRRLFGGRLPTPQEKREFVEESKQRAGLTRVFENNIYHVEAVHTPPCSPEFTHLVIRRHDWLPCKDWSHFQRIKNEVAGSECEAVELFPAESRLVDAGHVYHLWVHSNPKFRFPLGWFERFVPSEMAAASCAAPAPQIPLGSARIQAGMPSGAATIPQWR